MSEQIKECKDYTEILILDRYLTTENIPHVLKAVVCGYIVFYPDEKLNLGSASQTLYSRGSEWNELAICGKLITEKESEKGSFIGYKTADEVFERIKSHYEKHKKVIDEYLNGLKEKEETWRATKRYMKGD